MHEFKEGTLKDSHGKKVTDIGQAIAIAFAASRHAGERMEHGGSIEDIFAGAKFYKDGEEEAQVVSKDDRFVRFKLLAEPSVIHSDSLNRFKRLLENGTYSFEKFKHGGAIENQYEGKSASEVWDSWSIEQRRHFIKDHMEKILHPKDVEAFWEHYKGSFKALPERAKEEVERHIEEGEYKKGGHIGFKGLQKEVAKEYKGRSVAKKYQKEYGKTYDAAESKEVGAKVARKIKALKNAKKSKRKPSVSAKYA